MFTGSSLSITHLHIELLQYHTLTHRTAAISHIYTHTYTHSHIELLQYHTLTHTHSHIELLQYHTLTHRTAAILQNLHTHTHTQNCCNITVPTHTRRTVAIALSVWIGTIFEYATMTTCHVTPVTLELDEGLPVLFQFFSFYLVETLSDSPTRKQIN